MKSSALRTWLRQERAREHADDEMTAVGYMREWDEPSIGAPWDDGFWDDMAWRCTLRDHWSTRIREPRADVHIHGRDCDWYSQRRHYGAATCGVDGEYPTDTVARRWSLPSRPRWTRGAG